MGMSDLQLYPLNFVWASMNYISVFRLLKTDIFQLRFLNKIDMRISTAKKYRSDQNQTLSNCCSFAIIISKATKKLKYMTLFTET